MKIASFVIASLSFLLPAGSGLYADIHQAAGEFVCAAAKEKGKGRLAVFPLTDANDDETSETSKATTKLIGAVAGCGINVIDQTKVKHVLDQQAMGESGLVDAETAPEVGKLTGADALAFGAVDPKSIQIRLVDAVTGQVIGAGVIELPADAPKESKDKIAPAKVTKIEGDAASKSFEVMQLRQVLKRLYKRNPRVFAYAVSSDQELKEFEKKRPAQYKALMKLINKTPDKKRRRLEAVRARVLAHRAADQAFDDSVKTHRSKVKHD